jgi:predicted transcriptional regulator
MSLDGVPSAESDSRADGNDIRSSRANRKRELAQYVLDHGTVTVTELVERFGVSQMTVHRHLTELERQGVVRRFRGGASAQPSGVFESNVLYRMSAMQLPILASRASRGCRCPT